MFQLGYNTNGLAHHRLVDAMRLLAEAGYEGIAITPDVGQLDPYALRPEEVSECRLCAEDLGLGVAIETGARFVLDARRKHYPTLLEETAAERGRRVDFLRRSVDLAVDLGAGVVSLWAGAAPDGSVGDPRAGAPAKERVEPLWDRLCDGLVAVLEHALGAGVRIAFEPEPGMFVECPAGYGELVTRLGSAGEELGLSLDVGHCLCTGDLPVEDEIRRWAPRIVHVALDDMANGVHEHRMFGSGDLDLRTTLGALVEVGYAGMAAVELSRDSHRAAEAVSEAMSHLRKALAGLG